MRENGAANHMPRSDELRNPSCGSAASVRQKDSTKCVVISRLTINPTSPDIACVRNNRWYNLTEKRNPMQPQAKESKGSSQRFQITIRKNSPHYLALAFFPLGPGPIIRLRISILRPEKIPVPSPQHQASRIRFLNPQPLRPGHLTFLFF